MTTLAEVAMPPTGTDPLLKRVEAFLEEHDGLSPGRFGKLACNDRSFVFDLRSGREPRRETRQKVERFMADYEPPVDG